MKALLEFWKGHGTKALGTAAFIISGLLAVPNLIEPGTFLKVLQVSDIVIGALVVNRGFTNTRNARP